MLAKAARALVFAGDLDGGLELYEHAVALHLELGQTVEVVRSRALMAGHLFDGGRRAAAIALLRETLPLAQRDAALHSRLQTRLAMMLVRDSRLDEAWEALQAIDTAMLDPVAEPTGEYYLCASELHAVRGEPEPWRACFDRGIAIYDAFGHPGPLQVAHSNFADQALALGETELARQHHRIGGELAQSACTSTIKRSSSRKSSITPAISPKRGASSSRCRRRIVFSSAQCWRRWRYR